MPKLAQGPHLFKRKARYDKDGKLTHRGTFFIIDGKQIATGCSFADAKEAAAAHEAAKLKLHEYNVERYSKKTLVDGLQTHEVKIGDLIAYYLEENGEEIQRMPDNRRREYLGQIERLNAGGKFVSEIKRKSSLEYQKDRKSSVVRNELIALRALINFCASEGKVKKFDGELNYHIPTNSTPRMHYYSIPEVIALYKAARRKKHMWHGKPTHYVATHVARFMLVAAITGTRVDRIVKSSFYPEPGMGWLDLESGIYYRTPDNEFVPSNKLADPIRLPDRLRDLMIKWRDGYGKIKPCRYVVEFNGKPAKGGDSFLRLRHQVLPEERAAQLNRHSFKHTCITWLLQAGVSIQDVADYVSTDVETLKKTYKHVIPGEYSPVNKAFSRNEKVGKPREREGRNKAA